MSVSKITSSYNTVRTYSSPTNKSASQSRINTTSKSVSSSQKASSSMQKTSSYVKSNNTADKNATSVSTNNSSAGGRSSSAINTSRSTAVIKPSSVTSKQNVVGKTTPSVQKSSVVSTARSSLSTKSNAAIKQNSTTTKSQTSISGKASTVPTYSAKSNPSGKTVTTSKNATSASSAKASKATVTKAATAIKTTSNKNVSTNVSVSSSARASLSKTSSAVKTVTSTNVNSKKIPQKASAVVRTESEKAVAKSTASVNKSKISGSNNSTKATSALSKKIATKVNTSNVNTTSTAKKKSSKPTESDIKNAPAALAAKNVGIEINSKGEPIGNKEEIKKFNKEMERLRGKEANIMAAKAGGIDVDPSGNPRINGKFDYENFEKGRKLVTDLGYVSVYSTAPNVPRNTQIVYKSKGKTIVSTGNVYDYNDVKSLNNKTVSVINNGGKAHNVTVKLDDNLTNIIMTASKTFDVDPTLVVAVMAHESQFQYDARNSSACGLMQVHKDYYAANVENHKQLIEDLGGNPNDVFDPVTNVIAWGNGYEYWTKRYGEEDALKALNQGYKNNGWTATSENCAKEFIDIKNQLDNMIFES